MISSNAIAKSYPLFGSKVEITLYDVEEGIALPIMDEAYSLGLRLQKIFNLYDEKSELSSLNRERALAVSPELLHVLRLALEFCALSGGEYDVAKGRQFLQRKQGRALMSINATYKDIQITGNKVQLMHNDVWIDLGSIAKGYIAESMATYLQEQGAESGYVDARGDIRFFGEEMTIGVKHPRADGNICSIGVANKGVATSGDYNQFKGSYDQSHILNKKDVISATVVADDLMLADAYASLLMVCDAQTRENIMLAKPIMAMTITSDLEIHYFNGFEQVLR